MAGVGQRFKDAGYADPKPLIRLGDGRMIIEHVLDMFDRENDDFVFIVNETHDYDDGISSIIKPLVSSCVVEVMPDHKLGPVHTLTAAFQHIGPYEEVIVAYCDGKVSWDYSMFKTWIACEEPDGCLITHTGFHPHTLSSTKMAFVQETDGRVSKVQEKQSFTDNPFNEHASSGIYYFRRGGDIERFCTEYLQSGKSFRGEYYVTLIYNFMIANNLRVTFYDTDFVAILGTPHEIELFNAWLKVAQDEFVENAANAAKCFDYWKNYAATDENRQNTVQPERPS